MNVVPKLADLIADPAKAANLPPEAVPSMLGELERLRAILWVRLTAGNHDGQGQLASNGDRLLDVEEAARKLGKSKDYLYRHSRDYLFTVRDGRSLRFSEQGIEKFIRQRMAR
ncbi:MAG: hypothetical protein A3F68_07660 [Acidobacteria bacterium RIFCSPLOWO2_12_FULL_54_10]|nr:MAG: hypothetical protein A3F68_07660 [Acidobacteria bacterium RIFCSPLOWO2_12_FULL_54_10]